MHPEIYEVRRNGVEASDARISWGNLYSWPSWRRSGKRIPGKVAVEAPDPEFTCIRALWRVTIKEYLAGGVDEW